MHGDLIKAHAPMEIYYSTWRYPEQNYTLHAHDFYEFYLFLKGDVTYVVEDCAIPLVPGDLVIVPPGKFHRAAFDDLSKPYERIIAYVSREHLQSLRAPGFSAGAYIDAQSALRAYRRRLPPEDVKAWVQLQRSCVAADLPPARQLEHLCQLGALIARACAHQASDAPPAPGGVIESVVSYINEHYQEDLTLEMLSRRFFLTEAHLSHLFRRYAHLSVHRYITAKRMMLARTLLAQGTPPQEVCSRCGYRDYSSFYRAFTRAEGLSPRCYCAKQQASGAP